MEKVHKRPPGMKPPELKVYKRPPGLKVYNKPPGLFEEQTPPPPSSPYPSPSQLPMGEKPQSPPSSSVVNSQSGQIRPLPSGVTSENRGNLGNGLTVEGKNCASFMEAVRMRESSGNYNKVNRLGYLGAYQFGMARLSDLGYTERKSGSKGFSNENFQWKEKEGYSEKAFLDDRKLQDEVFKKHVCKYMEGFRKNYKVYINSSRMMGDKEIYITLSGMVAGAHLVGYGDFTRKFLENGLDPEDGNGTLASQYVQMFESYDLEDCCKQ